MAGGRPSDYTPELLVKAQDYIDNWKKYDSVPQIAGFAIHLGINRDTAYSWSKQDDKQAFSDIFSKVLALQERKLINSGLDGDFNPAITKMMLTKHGYSDKIETDLTSSDGSMTPSRDFNEFYGGNDET